MSRQPEPAVSLEDIEAVFAALAHEARRHIVLLLGVTGGELPSGYLAKRFAHSWPTTTRHLKVLESAGVVIVERRGRSSYYRLDAERVKRVLGGWLTRLGATPSPEMTWTSRGPKTTRDLAAREPTLTKPSRNRKGTPP